MEISHYSAFANEKGGACGPAFRKAEFNDTNRMEIGRFTQISVEDPRRCKVPKAGQKKSCNKTSKQNAQGNGHFPDLLPIMQAKPKTQRRPDDGRRSTKVISNGAC
jgi:hypothetical protein